MAHEAQEYAHFVPTQAQTYQEQSKSHLIAETFALGALRKFDTPSISVNADGSLNESKDPIKATAPASDTLTKYGFGKEGSSILAGGFDVRVDEAPKPEKGFLDGVKEALLTGKPTEEVAAERFGNTIEGKIQQKILLNKMTPAEQAVLLREDDPKSRIFRTPEDFKRELEVQTKFAKLVEQEKEHHMKAVLDAMSPAERAALKKEMQQMKTDATIDFQTGKVDLPQPGPNVKRFYERLAQSVLA